MAATATPVHPAALANGFASLELAASPESFTIIVFGASGDLAKKKTFPALFELFTKGLLPRALNVFGFARSARTDSEFRDTLRSFLKGDDAEEQAPAFLERCFYRQGSSYDDTEAFSALIDEAAGLEGERANRLFYMAIPPTLFSKVGAVVRGHGLSETGWNRVVVEKPFGKDFASSAELSASLAESFIEEQIYRIDHYLGKEMVQNLMVLRFGNAVFEPIWNRHYVKMVTIAFKEPFGISGRAGYFDKYGIIRDVMQNHLMQVLSLVAMEPPVTLAAEDIRDEKVKVLRAAQPIHEDNVVVGQYKSNGEPGSRSYVDEDGVPSNSRTPTFATVVVYIQNQRWAGVPFVLKAGKALNERKAEVRIQYRDSPHFLYAAGEGGSSLQPVRETYADASRSSSSAASSSSSSSSSSTATAAAAAAAAGRPPLPVHAPLAAPPLGMASSSVSGRGYDGSWLTAPVLGPTNELVIRIQPDESVYLKTMSKVPGLDNTLESSELNLSFQKRFPHRKSPEAYARLIFDVLRGDQSQFVRADELAAAWAIFTPILHRLDGGPGYEHLPPISVEPYRFGERGPQASDQLLHRLGFKYDPAYSSSWHRHAEPKMMRAVREELVLPVVELEHIARAFTEEMHKGLRDNRPTASTIRQIYTFMDDRLTGREEGTFWGLDIGGTNIRLVEYTVSKGEAPKRVARKGEMFDADGVYKKTIPHTVKNASGAELFSWLADACIEAGVSGSDSIGFCFSFPYLQTALSRGFLLYWTKEFTNPGVALDDDPDASVEDMAKKEVGHLLQSALASKGVSASVVAIVNDTVGTLVSGLRLDSATTIGLILGTGTNACYIENKSQITKLPDWVDKSGKGAVCMEWGGFSAGKAGDRVPAEHERLIPLTEFDLQVLSETAQPGRQVFEKLISGKYLGAIARAALAHLFRAGEVFQGCDGSCALLAPLASGAVFGEADDGLDAEDSHGPLSTRMLFEVVKDLTASGAHTRAILKRLGLQQATAQDIYITREVCKLVARRAARLVGTGLSAILRHLCAERGLEGDCDMPAVVAVDGSVFEHNCDFVVDAGREGFKSWVLEAMGELGVRAELTAIDSASFEGAAVVAAIAARRQAEGDPPQSVERAAEVCHAERSS